MSQYLSVRNLKVGYLKNDVIRNLNVEFERGKVNGLVGMNGAGKTTLLKTLFGIISQQSGEILWEGSTLKSEMVGYLETENYFYPKMKGREYLELFKLKNPEYDPDRWNSLFDLPLDRLVDEYSTGMKKKLALLGVLALDRPILMLDEPFNGVDLESNEKIKLLLERLRANGTTVIITSHVIESLISISDNMFILRDGAIAVSAQRENFSEIMAYLQQVISEEASQKIDDLFSNRKGDSGLDTSP